MLSVINRGTQVGSETEGIPYQLIDGYDVNAYEGLPLNIIKLSSIQTPLSVDLPVEVQQGYNSTGEPLISVQNLISIDLQPLIKNGYTQITVEPRED